MRRRAICLRLLEHLERRGPAKPRAHLMSLLLSQRGDTISEAVLWHPHKTLQSSMTSPACRATLPPGPALQPGSVIGVAELGVVTQRERRTTDHMQDDTESTDVRKGHRRG